MAAFQESIFCAKVLLAKKAFIALSTRRVFALEMSEAADPVAAKKSTAPINKVMSRRMYEAFYHAGRVNWTISIFSCKVINII